MLRRLLLGLTFFSQVLLCAYAQDFTFVNNSTVLNKSVVQTPAHWYLECVNHTDRVLNLRWKARLISIPSEWVIDLNDQTNNVVDIQDGEESDFELEVLDVLPQKLVISAHLNLTVGNGTVSFDVWDPLVPDYVQTIDYVFNISPHILEVTKLENDSFFTLNGGLLKTVNDKPLEVFIYNSFGQLLYQSTDVKQLDLMQFDARSLQIVQISQGNKVYQLKLVQ